MRTGYRRKKDLEKYRQSLCDLRDKSKWSNMNVIQVQEGGEAGKKMEKWRPNFPQIGLPWWLRWWRICQQCRRPGLDPWVRKVPWRREWRSTPVFVPGESHGQRSFEGHSLCCHKESESDMTEWLTLSLFPQIKNKTKPTYEPMSQRHSMNSKQNKCKENYIKALHNQIAENKLETENLESRQRKKRHILIQREQG